MKHIVLNRNLRKIDKNNDTNNKILKLRFLQFVLSNVSTN